MAATSTTQVQSGGDSSVSLKDPTVTTSMRTEPETTTTSTRTSGEEVTESVTLGHTSRTIQKQRIGARLTFSLKIVNNPPPKLLS